MRLQRSSFTKGAALAGVLLALGLAVSGAEVPAASVWTATAPKIDGNAADWEGVPLIPWEKGSVQYAFKNDADHLYILFVFKDPKVRSSVEQTGITIYFSPEGKKSKDYAVQFRKRVVSGEQYLAILDKQGLLTDDVKSQINPGARYNYYGSDVVAKKAKAAPAPAGPGTTPALFRYQAAGSDLVYEFAVPLKRSAESAAGVGVEPGTAFSIGFFWGGLTEEQKMAETKRLAAAASVANEEGLSGSSSRLTATSSGPKPKEYDFWQPVKLAVGAQ